MVWEKCGLSRETLSNEKFISEAIAREVELFQVALTIDEDPEKHVEKEVDVHPNENMLIFRSE